MAISMSEDIEKKHDALALLRKLEWRVRDSADSVLGGDYRSAFRGRGREFDQVVRYEWGDDVRDIDWNVTARLGEPYRKKYIEEREMTMVLVIEDAVSLQFGSGGKTKREALLEIAGLLGLLCAANRDRLGIVHATPEGYSMREPVRGRRAIMHAMAGLMAGTKPKLFHESPSLQVPWKELSHTLPKHTLLLWLSDFTPKGNPEGWQILKQRFQLLGFRVDDPWERELPHVGTVTAYDPLSAELVYLDTEDNENRAEHAAWCQHRENFFKELFPDPLSRCAVLTEESVLEAMLNFFRARMKLITH
ncbi:MAG: DUF58 domain-containing protein [Verrucomicrobiota bacterium]